MQAWPDGAGGAEIRLPEKNGLAEAFDIAATVLWPSVDAVAARGLGISEQLDDAVVRLAIPKALFREIHGRKTLVVGGLWIGA